MKSKKKIGARILGTWMYNDCDETFDPYLKQYLLGETRQGKARQGKARQKARQGKARHSRARQGKATLCKKDKRDIH